MPRPTPRPRRGTPDETRARLVEAAAQVFNRDGYFATDSNKLARAAGYSPGTFYQHFPDKRSIFLAAYQRWASDERDEIGAVLASTDSARRTRAVEVARVILAQHQRWAMLRKSLRALVLTDDVVSDFVTAQRRLQLTSLEAARRKRGLARTRADDWALLLYLERVADSVAWGEAKAVGVSTRGLEAALARALSEYF